MLSFSFLSFPFLSFPYSLLFLVISRRSILWCFVDRFSPFRYTLLSSFSCPPVILSRTPFFFAFSFVVN